MKVYVVSTHNDSGDHYVFAASTAVGLEMQVEAQEALDGVELGDFFIDAEGVFDL